MAARLALALTALALAAGGLELAGWAVDGGVSRDRVRAALVQVSRSRDPISDQIPCPWSDPHSVYVRAPETGPDMGPFMAMGKAIAPGFRKPRQVPLRPDQAPAKRRLVFVVGGSAAFGFPYPAEQSLAARLQTLLGPAYRVINAAQPGWTSGQLVQLLRRLGRFSPHAVVLFLGNNEWIYWNPEPLTPAQRRALTAWRLAAHSHLLSRVLYSLNLNHWAPAGDPALRNDPQDRKDLFDAAAWLTTRERFLANLQQNLGAMIRLASTDRRRVLLLTMPFNYRLHPKYKRPQPYSLAPGRRAELRRRTGEVTRLLERGRHAKALAAADRALALEPRAPLLHHLRGELFNRMARFPESERAFALAREHTVGNLGSVLSVNRTIREAARQGGATLVDVKKLFDEHEHAGGRYFNQSLIHDECHPTAAGHGLMAEAVARVLRR